MRGAPVAAKPALSALRLGLPWASPLSGSDFRGCTSEAVMTTTWAEAVSLPRLPVSTAFDSTVVPFEEIKRFQGLCAPFNQANTVVWSCKGSLSMICSSDYQNHFVVCCCSASILQDVTSKSLCYCVFWGGTDLLNRSNIHFPITAETLKTWFWNCKKN